jgi:hypothetical protein
LDQGHSLVFQQGRLNNQQALEGAFGVFCLLSEDVTGSCLGRRNRQDVNALGGHNLAGRRLLSLVLPEREYQLIVT